MFVVPSLVSILKLPVPLNAGSKSLSFVLPVISSPAAVLPVLFTTPPVKYADFASFATVRFCTPFIALSPVITDTTLLLDTFVTFLRKELWKRML